MSDFFINPYNFIPFIGETSRVNEEGQANLTGCIEYSVYTKTPLFVPNTSNDNVFGYRNCDQENTPVEEGIYHKSYEFFSYDNLAGKPGTENGYKPTKPVIPGSEIRGMFRSNYEIITDSCLPFVDSDQILHKRVAGFFQPGLIKKNGNSYDLYSAEDCLLRTAGINNLDTSDQDYDMHNHNNSYKYGRKSFIQDNFVEGKKISVSFFQNRERGKKLIKDINASNCRTEGYIIKGEPGPEMQKEGKWMPQNKHCAHVFIRTQGPAVKKGVDVTRLDDTLKVYEQNGEHTYRQYSEQWKSFKRGNDNEFFPVYYSKTGENYYLSPASGTLETYKQTIENIVQSRCACKDKNNLCPACKLFGMVNEKTGAAVSSRVRFTDLNCLSEDPMDEIHTLQELSSPKLQNMEFYLKRPSLDAQFWTYEYWIDKNGETHVYKDSSPVEFNGRKFYWHTDNVADDSQEITERNITIRPVKSGIQFTGKVYFENITEKELEQLVWVINCGEFGENIDKKKHGYKLGHAKPLGYGSIATKVKKVIRRSVTFENIDKIDVEYKDIYESIKPECEKSFNSSNAKENFNKMTNFDITKDYDRPVEYPSAEDRNGNEEVYTWFVYNHGKHFQGNPQKGKPASIDFPDKRHSVMPQYKEEMAFCKYMAAMKLNLQPVFGDPEPDDDMDAEGENEAAPVAQALPQPLAFNKLTIYEGTVTGFDSKSKLTRVKLPDGREGLVQKTPKGIANGTTIKFKFIRLQNKQNIFEYVKS